MKQADSKTNAMRLLDRAGIAYSVLTYPVTEDDLSGFSMARHLQVDPALVYKTLVLKGANKGVLVCLLPVERSLDLKALAVLCKDKRVEPLSVKELLQITGYVRGGCSPIGMKRPYPVYADSSLETLQEVIISAGKRGMQLRLLARDLIAVCSITLGPVTQDHQTKAEGSMNQGHQH